MIENILESLQHLINPDWIMKNGGLYLVLLILFIETGIIIGFFLPGDPLLFISGMVIASANELHSPFPNELINLSFWMVMFATSTILGNFFGYWFGFKFKYFVIREKNTWLIKRKHIQSAREFYDKRGGFTIAIARFLPIVRTFAPIVAGTVKMDFRKFALYNIIGAVAWVGIITTAGYMLGDIPWVQKNLEYILLGLVLIATIPVLIKLVSKKKDSN